MNKLLTALTVFGLTTLATAKPQHPHWPPKDYALCYGGWDAERVARAVNYDLLVVHPGDDFGNLTPALVEQLKAGADKKLGTPDDVVVLAYVTIGEDDKVPAGPPKGAEQGPVFQSGKAIKPGKAGYPTRYLDQVSYVFDANGDRQFGENGKPTTRKGQDGVPDENGVWGSYYVNAGDTAWHDVVLGKMRRLQNELKVDGFFLDTLDTASPWGDYSYTQPQMANLLQRIRKTYPDRFIMANRGMFLLENHRDAYVSSIDGLLYESLYGIWDWGAGRGIQSPWALGDYDYLKSPVLPAAKGSPGFHLFYVNYLSPKQPDFYVFLHAIEDLVGRKGISNYVSDPNLQELSDPISQVFPETGGGEAPRLSELKLTELSLGRFRLNFQCDGLDGRELGKDVFLDLRLGVEKRPPHEIPLLAPIPVDYGSWKDGVVGVGLAPGATQTVYARVVGKTRTCRSPYQEVSVTIPAGPQPGQVTELTATSLEKSVRLSWKPAAPGLKYRLYHGPTPATMKATATVSGSTGKVESLVNNQSHYFSVSAIDSAGREGSLCRPIVARAEDCTPPAVPAEMKVQMRGNELTVSWSAVAEASAYKVYCVAEKERYRIPVRVDKEQTEANLGKLGKGRYFVWVTASDEAGNESKRGKRVQVDIK